MVRVAGNIAGDTQIGSIEFAVLEFGTRLVVVLGHSRCGAIADGVVEQRHPGGVQSLHLGSIIDQVRPSLEGWTTEAGEDWEEIARKAVRANVRASVNQLRQGSKVLEWLIEEDGLLAVGVVYSLETGQVDFFEGVEETEPTQEEPMKLYAVRVFVEDWDRACEFYEHILGLPVKFKDASMEWAELDVGGPSLAPERVIAEEANERSMTGRFLAVSLRVDDISATYQTLLERGVEFTAPPEKQSWGGTLAHFKDSEGNILALLRLR